ncbi:MAG: glycosyltransferase family 9 protein [Proteobacteria bacterium]|nr:glycosyltransferase family 9 protein [Pseudomonadota bacterium]
MSLTTILNGFGISLGDSLIGLQALHAARMTGAIEGSVVLGRTEPPAKPLVPQLYRQAAGLAETLPMADAPRDGRVIDIRDFAFDPLFAELAMIDFFLVRLGLQPEAVPDELKRISWLAPRLRDLPALPLPRGYVLVCPEASIRLRDMPAAVHEALVERLSRRGWGPIVTQGPPVPGARTMPLCDTIEALCALVAGARCVVSTDTAMVHLADAFSVPCLAILTTHRPAMRVRDYPLCRAIRLPIPGLPESIEFVRGDEDLAAAHAAWFPDGPDLLWLDRALDQFELV